MTTKVERPVSAGGVVYRMQSGDIEILLCGHEESKSWRLPKGTPEPGETWEQTALREVTEETGLEVAIEEKLPSIQYWFRAGDIRNHKTVHFYLMRPTGGSIDNHDPEFDMVHWFKAEDANEALTFKSEASVVVKAVDIVTCRIRKKGNAT